MSEFTVTIEIPALDRLCDWLAGLDRAKAIEELKDEIIARLKAAAKTGDLERAAKASLQEVPVTEDHPWKEEALAPELEPEGPRTEPEPKPAPVLAPEPGKAEEPVTLDQVQRAAAQLRDAGKLKAVTDMFPEFGIKKLSDLKDAKLALFAERLKKLGARV